MNIIHFFKFFKLKIQSGTSLVQWLRLLTPNAVGPGLITDQGTRSHVMQLRVLEKEMATHSSILVWRIPWTEAPGSLQSIRSHGVRTSLKQLNKHTRNSTSHHELVHTPSSFLLCPHTKERVGERWKKERKGEEEEEDKKEENKKLDLKYVA